MGNGALKQMYYQEPCQEGVGEMHPFLRLPITDITGSLYHNTYNMQCRSYEANYWDCQEAYGNLMGKHACKDYYFDFMECQFQRLQRYRIEAMLLERWKQYVKGQLGMGPVVPHFAEAAKVNSWGPEIIDNWI